MTAELMGLDRSTRERTWRAHYVFQDALYGGGGAVLSGGEAFFSPFVADPEWNHAVIEEVAAERLPEFLAEAGDVLRQCSREVTVVISPLARRADLVGALIASGWRSSFRHRWLIYTPSRPLNTETASVVHIEEAHDEAAMQTFVRVFYAAFSTAQEELAAGYGEALMASWRQTGSRERCEVVHYLASLGNEPVAIGTRIQGDGVAGFYNLGVVPKHRRRGFGAALSARRLRDARRAGAELILLQTEDDAVTRWQLAQGWEEAFTLVGWTR